MVTGDYVQQPNHVVWDWKQSINWDGYFDSSFLRAMPWLAENVCYTPVPVVRCVRSEICNGGRSSRRRDCPHPAWSGDFWITTPDGYRTLYQAISFFSFWTNVLWFFGFRDKYSFNSFTCRFMYMYVDGDIMENVISLYPLLLYITRFKRIV